MKKHMILKVSELTSPGGLFRFRIPLEYRRVLLQTGHSSSLYSDFPDTSIFPSRSCDGRARQYLLRRLYLDHMPLLPSHRLQLG